MTSSIVHLGSLQFAVLLVQLLRMEESLIHNASRLLRDEELVNMDEAEDALPKLLLLQQPR